MTYISHPPAVWLWGNGLLLPEQSTDSEKHGKDPVGLALKSYRFI
jgi:hypothetical protein